MTMIYDTREQAELELEMNKQQRPHYNWKIAEWDFADGTRHFEPIKVCNYCGERLTPNHRC